MKERIARLGKWLLKVGVTYAVFAIAGLGFSLIPARSLGLSEQQYFRLRMFFILLGPVCLTLLIRIILTLTGIRRGNAAVNSQGPLLALSSLLLFFNLSHAQSVSDLTTGLFQAKGLDQLNSSRQYKLKGKKLLNVLIPVCLSLLGLEVIALLVCIAVFSPLSQTVSYFFIGLITLTAMAVVLFPLILTLVSGIQGDRSRYKEKREQEKETFVRSDYQVLESDPALRRKYMRFPRRLFFALCPGLLILSLIPLSLTRDLEQTAVVALIRQAAMGLSLLSALSFFPLLFYWIDCSGTSLVQRISISRSQLVWSAYSGSMEERVETTLTLIRLESFQVTARTIRIRGEFARQVTDRYGVRDKGVRTRTLRVLRTLSPQQEEALLSFLADHSEAEENRRTRRLTSS